MSTSISSITHSESTLQIAIIGGGLTGLITADLLEQSLIASKRNFKITIFEKSAGVGRLATRYEKPQSSHGLRAEDTQKCWQFDFGAQFFTAKTQAFQTYLKPWIDHGVVEPWQAQTARFSSHVTNESLKIELSDKWDDLKQPRFISSPKMTSWGRAIAKKLCHTTIRFKTRVAPLAKATLEKGKTVLNNDKGHLLGSFDWVICTAPQGQAIELVADTEFEHFAAISQHKMLACYTLMLGWETADALPPTLREVQWDVLTVDTEQLQQTVLSRVFIEHNKPSRTAVLPSVTIHANNKWAEQYVDDEIDDVKAIMLAEAKAVLGFNESTYPAHLDCHRWRFAATELSDSSTKLLAYVDDKKQWVVTGDWCGEGRIESCYEAASNVVQLIL